MKRKEHTMSNLVVLTFDSAEEAEQVHQALKDGKKQGILDIDDAAVVEKDSSGKVHVKNQISHGTWTATGVGGMLGLLMGMIFFPLGGLVLGLAGGALVGRMMHLGVDGKFVKDVEAELQPGTSALFILTSNANPTATLAILRNYKGKVLQTTLDSELEESLKKSLSDDTPSH
jgi:uncharacterized membrane protein